MADAGDMEKSGGVVKSLLEIEEYYQTLAAEVDSRIVKLVSSPCRLNDDSPDPADHQALLAQNQACVVESQRNWASVLEASHCMRIHLENAARYQQFCHEAAHSEAGLKQLTSWCRNHAPTNDSAQAVSSHIKESLQHLLAYQVKVDALYAHCDTIVPVPLRRRPVDIPLKVKALINYDDQQVKISKDEECLLLDNSEITKWKVRTSSGEEVMLPALIFLVPAPDREAVRTAQRVRQQLLATWSDCVNLVKRQGRKFFLNYFNKTDSKEVTCLSEPQRADVLKCLDDMTTVLTSSPQMAAPAVQQFLAEVQQWHNQAASRKPPRKDQQSKAPGVQDVWQQNAKLVQHVQEFETYMKSYKDDIDATCRKHQHLVGETDSDLKYVSSAYIEKLKPVEIKHKVPEDEELSGHVTLAEKSPSKRRPETETESAETETVTRSLSNDFYSSQTIKQTQTFVIVGVIDPRNDENISIYSAIADGVISRAHGLYCNPDTGVSMPIPEAMNRGLIKVEYTDTSVEMGELVTQGIIRATTSTEIVSYMVHKVVDPVTGDLISILEAVQRGIIDLALGQYHNTVTDERLSIPDAIEQGLLQVEIANRQPREDIEDDTDGRPGAVVTGVMNPQTGKHVNLPEAIKLGIIDMDNGTYRDPATGETMAIATAISRGFIKIRPADPEKDRNSIHVIPGHMIGDIDIEPAQSEISSAIYGKLKDKLDLQQKGIYEQATSEELTIEEAFEGGVLGFDPLCIANIGGEKYSLPEASVLGLIEPTTMASILETVEPYCLQRLIDSKELNPETGKYRDPRLRRLMPLDEAITAERVDSDLVFFTHVPSHSVMSLSSAVNNHQWNPKTGMLTEAGEEMTLEHAINLGIVDPEIDSEKVVAQAASLKFLKTFLDTDEKQVSLPWKEKAVSLDNAILSGAFNIGRTSFVNATDGRVFSLPEAVDMALIEQETAKNIYEVLSSCSLSAVIADGCINPNTGKYMDEETGAKMSMLEAIERGCLDPTCVFLVDNTTHKVKSLQAFIEDRQFNPASGKFVDPNTNEEVTIARAIDQGIIAADFSTDEFIREKCTLADLINGSKLNTAKALFDAPNGQEMSLKESLANGFLTLNSVVQMEPLTGHVILAGDGDIVKALIDTKNNLDWVGEVETSLAQQTVPSSSQEDIQLHLEKCQDIQATVDDHKAVVTGTVEHAQQLLDNNREVTRHTGEEQQYQRLRFNTSDLKVRFEGANNQLDARKTLLDGMMTGLDTFKDKLNTFSLWTDDAQTQISKMKQKVALSDDLDSVKQQLQDFSEHAMVQEDMLQAISKTGHQVLDEAQKLKKEKRAFSRNIQSKNEVSSSEDEDEVDDSSLIEGEIQEADNKLKTVLAECTDFMAKLTDTASKNKQYNSLKSKLTQWLPEMADRVDQCIDSITPGEDPKNHLDELKAITADVVAEGKLMEDLHEVGHDLVDILEELGCKDSPKAIEIQQTVADLQNQYDAIQQALANKQQDVNAVVVQSQDAECNLQAMFDWVNETQALFDNMMPVSLDKEVLNEQMRMHRVISSEIENHKTQVDSVSEQCEAYPSTQGQVAQLWDAFDELVSRSEERGEDIDSVVHKLATLHGNVNQLESWIANTVRSLKRESNEFDHGSIKDKIENLYRLKQKKQGDLDNIKVTGKDLIDNPNTSDKNRLRQTLASIQGNWHDLTELLVQMISFTAMREIDDLLKYLDRAENEINTAEPISTDPEILTVQLRDHKVFHEDLENKRDTVNQTIDKCNKMLRETTNAEADDIKNRLNTIRNQADLVCRLSNERLMLLEEALPLTSHFSETHADLQSWLGEIEAEIASLEVPNDSAAEQIRKQQDNAKMTQRIIEDHKPLVEDLNITGQELMEICTDDDASDIKEDVDNIIAKYDDVKVGVREKLSQLEDTLRTVSTELSDSLESLVEELHYLSDQVQYADPVAANPEALREQMADNNTIVGDLERRVPAIKSTKNAAAEELQHETPENREECEDLRCRLQDIDSLHDSIQQQTRERAQQLEEAVSVADAFHATYKDVMRALQDIQDNLTSQDSPGIDAATIGEQQKELEAIQSELSDLHVAGVLDECQRLANELTQLAGTPGKVELSKYMEDLDTILEEIEDTMKEREEELETTLAKAHKYNQTLQSIAVWLPTSETKIQKMSPVATDARAVRIQLEELKVLKLQAHGHYGDIQNLNQYASDLKHASPVTAESLNPQVQEIKERWDGLEASLHQRERDLNETLVRLGEIDRALDDMNGFLQQTECDLQELDDIYGDPKFIETHLKNLQLVQNDLANQEPMVTYLNEAVTELIERGTGPSSSWREKQGEMNELYESVCIMARDKQNRLQDTLKEVKAFAGDVEDLLRWLNNFRGELKTSEPMGALPDTAQRQFDKFLGSYRALEQKEDEVKALLLNGEDMLARCRERDTEQLREDLGRLRTRMYDTRSKADRRKGKLEEHLANVQDFHAMLKIHTDWLNNAEKILGSFKYPSKIVDRILKQIQDHQDFKQDIDAHRDLMYNLDRTGTYLKYFGRKQDTVYIKNLLISIKLRWKKLVRRAGEKGRMLQQAYKEDRRFYDSWRGLCDWLEDGERRLKKYATGTPGKVRYDLDELQHFQNELTTRHPTYYSTMRLGRNLKDRCIKSDPEQGMLINMLEELKNKWNILRSIVAQRQNKLDEALLSSGRITDALQSLLEWLSRAEVYLAEDQPVLGDLDTVNILIEQQKVFQQELDSRQSMVAAMRSSPTNDPTVATQLDELTSVWDRVNQLSQVREARLHEALKLAEDFNESVQVVREWLPQVEADLKFRSLPDNEDAIVQRIEQHDKLHGELQQQQANIERIKYLAQEILMACHPNAVRFVKYYLTITQTRWEQAMQRASQRSQRLQEALRNVRGNAVLLDELLAWLTEAQALLHTKTKDSIPEDLTVVEALVREHLEFHEDLTCKNKDVERVTKLPISAEGSKHLAAIRGSQWKLNEADTPNPRVNILQNRWRSVWRMSVERKKKLQDSLDHLLELESFKNFDFDMWRQRYMAWIRAKKLRITDFFRRQDKDGDGSLSRREFVEGMLASKFPTNRTELNAVFNVFDQDGSGSLDYKEFVDALKPDRQRHVRVRSGKRPASDGELIHDEIENQVSECQCRHQFRIQKMGDGKYKFGEKQKICLVRFLNHTVMVRVGGGWMTLAGFLENNDPCKAKGRTNTELREQFVLPEGSSQARATFTPKRGGTQANGSHYSSNSVSPAESSGSLHSSPSHQPAGTKPSATSTPRTTGPTTSTPRPSSRPKTTPGRTQNNGTPAAATPRSNKGGLRSAGSATGVRTKKVNSASASKLMPPPRNMRF